MIKFDDLKVGMSFVNNNLEDNPYVKRFTIVFKDKTLFNYTDYYCNSEWHREIWDNINGIYFKLDVESIITKEINEFIK